MEGPSCGAAFLAGATAALHSEKDRQKRKEKVSDKTAGVRQWAVAKFVRLCTHDTVKKNVATIQHMVDRPRVMCEKAVRRA